MRYGTPYKGSKNAICDRLAEAIPWKGISNFYDLFAGGCAMTHKMLLGGHYAHCHANDMDGQGLRLFMNAASGKYRDEKRWISREDFALLKGRDPYMACCWSFGNNQKNYLYSREMEPWKKALHHARALGDVSLMEEFGILTDGSRADIKAHHDEYRRKYIRWWLSRQEYTEEELNELIAKCNGDIAVQKEELRQYLLKGLESSGLTQAEVARRLGTQMTGHYFGRSQWEFPTEEHYRRMQTFMPALDQDYNEVIGLARLWQRLQRLQRLQSLQSLESLESLERLQRLQRLQSLERLTASYVDYREVEIPPGTVIYCDPPYIGTDGYKTGGFDHGAFYDWCRSQSELVLISEYRMPEDRFEPVLSLEKTSLLSQKGTGKKMTENLYVPRHQLETYRRLMYEQNKPRYIEMDLFGQQDY